MMNQKTQDAISGTDSKRIVRANNCDILLLFKRTPSFLESFEGIPTGWARYDYIVSSAEKSQNDSHQGYLVLDSKGSIKDCSCGATNIDGEMTLCGDFQYRWNYDLNRKDMASWDRYDGYEEDIPHTRDPASITNPSGKLSLCIAKDQYVTTQRGFVLIQNITTKDKVWTLQGWKPVKACGYTGKKETITLHLKSGKTLSLTPDHRVLSFDGKILTWKEAQDLTTTDLLYNSSHDHFPTQRKIYNVDEFAYRDFHYKPQQISLNETIAELCGYMNSDGAINSFPNENQLLLEDFSQKWKNVFGKNSCSNRTNICYIGVNGTKILKEIGLQFGSYKRTVPRWVIESADQNIKIAFLRGCYAGDGNFYKRISTYATVSAQFADELQLLLHSLNVNVKKAEYKSGVNDCDIWTLRTSSDFDTSKLYNLLNPIRGYSTPSTPQQCPIPPHYESCINFNWKSKIKSILLQSAKFDLYENTLVQLKNYATYVLLPNYAGSRDSIEKILKKEGKIIKKSFRKGGKPTHMAYTHDICEISADQCIENFLKKFNWENTSTCKNRIKFRNLIDQIQEKIELENLPISLNDEYLTHFVSANCFFDRLEKITKDVDVKNVYDLTVQDAEHFAVNNLIVHNCKHLYAVIEKIKNTSHADLIRQEDGWIFPTQIK